MPAKIIDFSTLPTKGNELFASNVFLNDVLPAFLMEQRWFTSKGKKINACQLIYCFALSEEMCILIVAVKFADGSSELYQLPLAVIWTEHSEALTTSGTNRAAKVALSLRELDTRFILAKGKGKNDFPLIVDAVALTSFRNLLFDAIQNNGPAMPFTSEVVRADSKAKLEFDRGKALSKTSTDIYSELPAIDSSNTAIVYNDRYFFKLFRKLDPGLNPDLELTRFLSEHAGFSYSPTYCGSFSIAATADTDLINLGMMIGKIANQGDAWAYFQKLTERFYTRIIDQDMTTTAPPRYQVTTSYAALAPAIQAVLDQDTYDHARLLGKRTGEMHLALAAYTAKDKDLVPELFFDSYREEIFAAANRLLDRQFNELCYKLNALPDTVKATADSVLLLRGLIEERLAAIRKSNEDLTVSRIHADYHLGQVLKTEDDFCIIDFEGEPLLSIPERRRKRPPFKDVAGMVRSFHYAAMGQLLLNPKYTAEQRRQLTNWGEWWFRQVRSSFLNGYMSIVEGCNFVPQTHAGREDLLDFFVLEKAIYETAYELNSRPDWLPIPLKGMLFALQDNKGK